MKRIFKNTYKTVFWVAVVFLIFLSAICGIGFKTYAVFADSVSSYSNVLEDLNKDNEFDINKYPPKLGDGSIEIIQVAESVDGELFIYTYQPGYLSTVYSACTVVLAREPNTDMNLDFSEYSLNRLSNSGTLYKYKVENFEVNSSAPVRYYNISSILRKWNRYFDMGLENGNTESEVPYSVEQLWTVTGTGETVNYAVEFSEMIEIQNKYVGYVTYFDGSSIKWNNVNTGTTYAHFVAFSTYRQIDRLVSVKLTFNETYVTDTYCCNSLHTTLVFGHSYGDHFDYTYSDPISHEITINYQDRGGNPGGGNYIKADPYAWYRIRSTSEFMADETNKDYKLTSGTISNVENTNWVLSFYETPFFRNLDNPLNVFDEHADESWSIVSNVMLLELEFETDGHPYKLGVVDNKQTGSGESGNEMTEENPYYKWKYGTTSTAKTLSTVGLILAIVLPIVGVIIAIIVLSIMYPPFGEIVKGVLSVIGFPFILIARLFKKGKE